VWVEMDIVVAVIVVKLDVIIGMWCFHYGRLYTCFSAWFCLYCNSV
jgi:hypothetical protein